ncbi:MAG: hypothetical protein R2862_12015 [Thermoanaerobaculia bacterium]
MSEPHSWILQMRQRLESPLPGRLGVGEARRAAVLVPLYVEGGQLWTILTKRAESPPHHRGHAAFGGV